MAFLKAPGPTPPMISSIYIASESQRLDFQLAMIRFFLLHPNNRDTRNDFIASQTKLFADGMKRYLEHKPDRDAVDDLVAPAAVRRHQQWLKLNLHHLIDFGEHRLNQMELILRYTFFESFLLKAVGNILWEYPQLRQLAINQNLASKAGTTQQTDRYRRQLVGNPKADRIAWTKGMVDAVDRLPFDAPVGKRRSSSQLFLSQYLHDGLNLHFCEKTYFSLLERIRRARNSLVHGRIELLVLNETLEQARKYLGNFPTLLVQAASKAYPKACTQEPPDEDDDGTPGYILAEVYY